jgi:hypothetical protein
MTRWPCLFRRSFPRCFVLGLRSSFKFFRAALARPTLPAGSSTVPELPHRLLTTPRTAASSWARSPRATFRASPPAPHWSPRCDFAPAKPTPLAPAATMARFRTLDPMGADEGSPSLARGATGTFSTLTDPGDFTWLQAHGAFADHSPLISVRVDGSQSGLGSSWREAAARHACVPMVHHQRSTTQHDRPGGSLRTRTTRFSFRRLLRPRRIFLLYTVIFLLLTAQRTLSTRMLCIRDILLPWAPTGCLSTRAR